MPGQNSWAESSDGVMFTSMESATQQREKRPRVDVEATDNMDVISILIICVVKG